MRLWPPRVARLTYDEGVAVLPGLGFADAVHGGHIGEPRPACAAPCRARSCRRTPHRRRRAAPWPTPSGAWRSASDMPPCRPPRSSASAAALAAARGDFRGGLGRVLARRDFVGALERASAGVGDRPGAVAGDVACDDAGAAKLAEDRAPFLLAVILAGADGRQAIVAEFQNCVAVIAEVGMPNVTASVVPTRAINSDPGTAAKAKTASGSPTRSPTSSLRHAQLVVHERNDRRHDQQRHAHGDASQTKQTK